MDIDDPQCCTGPCHAAVGQDVYTDAGPGSRSLSSTGYGGSDLRQRLDRPEPARRLTLDGVDTPRSSRSAPGHRCVLLHGGIESGGAYWAPVLARLARVIASSFRTCRGWASRRALDGVSAGRPGGAGSGRCCGPPARRRRCWSRTRCWGRSRPASPPGTAGSCVAWWLCGAPGIGPYRMPPGLLLLAAVLMGIRPSERSLTAVRALAVPRPARGPASGTRSGSTCSSPTCSACAPDAADPTHDATPDLVVHQADSR